MWTFEHTVEAALTPAQVWAVWTDVTGWPSWDHAIEWSRLEDVFQTGGMILLKPKGGPKVCARLTRVDPLEGFSDDSSLPLCKLSFDHRLVETGTGVRLTHRVEISGPLTFLFRRVIGSKLAQEMPSAMGQLVELAQQRSILVPAA
jgi:Polyketide cyclase / dehydrase and lipid transport